MLKNKTVIDINGDTQLKKNCILYLKNYYLHSHEDIYFIKSLNKYFHINQLRKTSGLNLILDSYNVELNTFNCSFDIIDYTENERVLVLNGDKTLVKVNNKYNKIYNLQTFNIYSKSLNQLLYDSNFIFNKNDSNFYYIGNANSETIEEIKNSMTSRVATNRAYNIEENLDYEYLLNTHKNLNLEIEKDTLQYKKYLKDYSYGVELETSLGSVFPTTLNKYGFSICRDGSISNAEYVSIPFKGVKGLESIKKFVNLNVNNVKTDFNCSYHVHIGNVRKDKVFINALYNFLYYFQFDYFNYFPFYKKENVLEKRKHYTKPLPDLCKNLNFLNEKNFKEIVNYNNKNLFLFLTDGFNPDSQFNKKTKRHPFEAKWSRVNRYYVFNFMNLIFSERGTIEFRIHENTWNYERVKNNILLSIAIIEFVDKHIKECLEGNFFTLNEVINFYFKNEVKINLLSYYENRKNIFKRNKLSIFDNYTENHLDELQ